MSFYLLFPHSLQFVSQHQNLALHRQPLLHPCSSELHQHVPQATGRQPKLKQSIAVDKGTITLASKIYDTVNRAGLTVQSNQ